MSTSDASDETSYRNSSDTNPAMLMYARSPRSHEVVA